MKGQMRQGLFPFLVLQTEECGLHLICEDTGLNHHSCHFKLLINCSAKKCTYFLGVICRQGVIICIGTKKRGYLCIREHVCIQSSMYVCVCTHTLMQIHIYVHGGILNLKQFIRPCEPCIFINAVRVFRAHI